jgi:hypothetical protein
VTIADGRCDLISVSQAQADESWELTSVSQAEADGSWELISLSTSRGKLSPTGHNFHEPELDNRS